MPFDLQTRQGLTFFCAYDAIAWARLASVVESAAVVIVAVNARQANTRARLRPRRVVTYLTAARSAGAVLSRSAGCARSLCGPAFSLAPLARSARDAPSRRLVLASGTRDARGRPR